MKEAEHIGLDRALSGMGTITLAQMDGVKLLNRIDVKYVTTEAVLRQILQRCTAAGYRVLQTEGGPINSYSTIYYDTPALTMFTHHRNKHLVRQKVRTRCYLSSGDCFLEIKRKNNHGRTRKKRIGIPRSEMMDFKADAAACEYLAAHSCFGAAELSPVLETAFRRITLVNPALTERLTIDTCLHFTNYRSGLGSTLQDAVIIELKQDGRAASQMKDILLDLRVKPFRVSKYCVAVTLTQPSARAGRFKLKVRYIEKLIGNKLVTI